MQFGTVGSETTAAAVEAAHLSQLRAQIASFATDELNESVVAAIETGETEALSILDVASVYATSTESVETTDIRFELLDRLIITLIDSVVAIDDMIGELPGNRSGSEWRACLEGDTPTTLSEYCHLEAAIARRS